MLDPLGVNAATVNNGFVWHQSSRSKEHPFPCRAVEQGCAGVLSCFGKLHMYAASSNAPHMAGGATAFPSAVIEEASTASSSAPTVE